MRRLLIIVLAGLWGVSCHIDGVAEDILELRLDDSLRTCARLDIELADAAGTDRLERIWSAAPPDPLVIRHIFAQAPPADFLIKIGCVDEADQVKLIKTIPYRAGNRGPVHVVEGPAARYWISSFKLLDSADADGDGHFRHYRIVLDVDANTNFDTLRMSLSYQVLGNPKWFPLIPSRRLAVTGAIAADTVIQRIEGGARRNISLKAEIRSASGDSLDEARIARIREETPGQDSAGLRWVFRNHTGAVLALDADVGSLTLRDSGVGLDDSVVVDLETKFPVEKIAYRAVAQGQGEPLAWEAESPMEMDRFDVEAVAPPSDSHFVLNILNRTGQAIAAILLNPGTPGEKTYPAELAGLPESRNLGLFPYATGTTLAFRLSGGGTRHFNNVRFAIHEVSGFRYADITLDP